MAVHLKKGYVKGITALGGKFKLCQFADDTTVLKDEHEVHKAVNCIKYFSDISGLRVNMCKSVPFPLKN